VLGAARAEAQRLAVEAAQPDPSMRPATKGPQHTWVLVADDSKVVRVKTGRLLAQHDYQVRYAVDGIDAAQQVQDCAPDLVITDVDMPGLDVLELTRQIRCDARTAQLPVIMITAADDRHREQAAAAGVSVLLGKPYADAALMAHIRHALGHEAAAAAAHHSAAAPAGASAERRALTAAN
jgi:CheY-like chemotaxis protein